jgi:hypothetical protein
MSARIIPLFNRDMLTQGFCQNVGNPTQALSACEIAFLACIIPQSRIYNAPTNLGSASYGPDLGAFPVDAYGMTDIFNWLNGSCSPSLQWTTRIVVPTPASTTVATAAFKTTPPPNSTPPPTTRGPTPRNDGQNNVGLLVQNLNPNPEAQVETPSPGNRVVVSFILTVLSALTVTMVLSA